MIPIKAKYEQTKDRVWLGVNTHPAKIQKFPKSFSKKSNPPHRSVLAVQKTLQQCSKYAQLHGMGSGCTGWYRCETQMSFSFRKSPELIQISGTVE